MSKPAISPKHRYECGKIMENQRTPAKETMEQVLAVAQWQRQKGGATKENFRDQKWGFPLGQMRMWAIRANSDSEGLASHQYEACVAFVRARHLARMAQGYPSESPKSIAAEMVAFGIGGATDLDDEEVFKRVRAYNGAKSAMLEYQQRGVQWVSILEALARDEPREDWHKWLGEVRSAGNVLARYFKIRG